MQCAFLQPWATDQIGSKTCLLKHSPKEFLMVMDTTGNGQPEVQKPECGAFDNSAAIKYFLVSHIAQPGRAPPRRWMVITIVSIVVKGSLVRIQL
jgi:hypothetical protein